MQKEVNILEISSRDFRGQQKKWFELADQGLQIIIKRGNKHSYILTPVKSDDFQLSEKMSQKIKEANDDYTQGRATVTKNTKELNDFLDKL